MPAEGPLSGVTIVDLSRVLAGPYCTMVLADLGARVIKVERPDGGDDARQIGPFVDGVSAYFASLNRGKQSIALDLKSQPDRKIFAELLERADVLVENFRPGAMERLGFGWDTLETRYPRLIYAGISGFGHTGPYASRPAYDMVVQAMGGIMSLTGQPGGEATRVGSSIGDITAGLFAAVGINGALLERERTNRGVKLDVGMLDAQVAILENAIARFRATGVVPGPLGSRHPSIAPFRAFGSSDGQFVIAAGNDALFAKLCECMERPDLRRDPRFESNDLRNHNEAELAAELGATLRTRPTKAWLEVLEQAGIPCGPINDVQHVIADPHVRARNMIVRSAGPEGAVLEMAGNPIKLSNAADPETRDPAPALDADRAKILRELGR